MYPPGRAALLQDPTVAEALRRVAAEGWEEEARMHAQSALTALSDRQRDPDHEQAPDQKHVMFSYQWGVQEVTALYIYIDRLTACDKLDHRLRRWSSVS